MKTASTLSPAQQRALDELLETVPRSTFTVFKAESGKGRTTILQEAHATLGGALVGAREMIDAMHDRHPFALEETLYGIVLRALEANDVVLVDDMHILANMLTGRCGMYPRPMFLFVPMAALAAYAAGRSKRLVLGSEPHTYLGDERSHGRVALGDFTADDFRVISRAYLGDRASDGIDFQRVHRFAPRLTAAQLRNVGQALKRVDPLDTDAFLEHLRATALVSNVDLTEVQAVELHDLKGMDDVLEALEANVLLPLENPELATELGLRPKRGILLAGPPGTGKTTIGRALAHRIRSKFFLVDGTVIAGTSGFYGQISHIFHEAAQNAPSIIFIDDSDVIFESGTELGLYRYLLTMLDGLESKTAGQVCLMLTTMDIGSIPPALVRSGRIELWLNTRLPDEAARLAILLDLRAGLAAAFHAFEPHVLASATEGLSGADLRRVVEDGKLLFAYDRATGRSLRPLMDYFLEAVTKVRINKESYAEAEARARAVRPQRPPYFDAMGAMSIGFMHAVEAGEEGWTGFAPMGG